MRSVTLWHYAPTATERFISALKNRIHFAQSKHMDVVAWNITQKNDPSQNCLGYRFIAASSAQPPLGCTWS